MPQVRRPRRGSLAFSPRVRARRIYPRIQAWPAAADAKPLGFAAYKAGMTHGMLVQTNPNSRIKGQLISRPLTVLECPALSVFGFRAYRKIGVALVPSAEVIADKLSKNLSRKLPVPKQPKTADQLKKVEGMKDITSIRLLVHTNPPFKKKPEVFELGLGGTVDKQLEYAKNTLGKDVKISDIFKAGDVVDVIAVTKGQGTEGPVKRWGVRMHGRKAQQMHRHTGSLGQTEPGKVRSTVPQGGQLGFQTRTELNKRIIKIGSGTDINPTSDWLRYGKVKGDYIILEGSVPGPTKRLIRLRQPIRPPRTKLAVDLKAIALDSKQGVGAHG